MVQNPEARNLDRINNTSCSPMVPVQSCHIAECKKMAEKNKKLIKKLEAKQKKALQRKFLSPEYLMSLYQQSWQNDWNLAYRMSREYEIHSRSLEKTYQRYYRRKNDNHFSGSCKKNRQRKQLYDMNGKKPVYWISEVYDLANFQSPPPYNQVFTEILLICETALFLWYRIFPKRPIRQPDVFYHPDSGWFSCPFSGSVSFRFTKTWPISSRMQFFWSGSEKSVDILSFYNDRDWQQIK